MKMAFDDTKPPASPRPPSGFDAPAGPRPEGRVMRAAARQSGLLGVPPAPSLTTSARGNVECVACPPGASRNADGFTGSCLNCLERKYAPTRCARSCQVCGEGSYTRGWPHIEAFDEACFRAA